MIPTRQPRNRLAFTLIELLVVVAIIGILAALTFPMVGRGRAAAHSAKCMSNLRQIYVAAQAWSSDNDGAIVPGAFGDAEATELNQITGILAPYLERTETTPFTSAKDLPVFVCPANPNQFGYGYNYNYLSWPQLNGGAMPKNVKVAKPSQTVLLCDSENLSQPDGSFLAWRAYVRPPSFGRWDHVVSFRHPGKTANVLWVDGHITSEKQDSPAMSPGPSNENPFWNGNGPQ